MKNIVWAIIKTYILFIAFFSSNNCISGSKRISNASSIYAIRLTCSLPVMDPKGNVLSKKDTIDIFYYQDMIMYKVSIVRSYSNVIVDKNGNIIKEELKNIMVDHSYLVHRKAERFGIKFDSVNAVSEKKINIDSFLSNNWISQIGSLIEKTNENSILVYSRLKNDVLVEKYVPKNKQDFTYGDSIIIYYSKRLKDVSYSFSKKMDSLKQMKLFKLQVIYNKTPYPNSGVHDMNFQFEFAVIPTIQSKELLGIFEKFGQIKRR